jgi:hypothetical protein
MSEKITFSTRYGRPLTRTEIQVFTFMENEREAIELSKFIVLPESATYEQIDEAVGIALAHRRMLGKGCPSVEGADTKRSDNRTYPAGLKPN